MEIGHVNIFMRPNASFLEVETKHNENMST